METNLFFSIILCTRNRAQGLKQTLAALAEVSIPTGWKVELIVVDNGSTDDTAAVVQNAGIQTMRVQYATEPKIGKANALNAGLARSQGEIILFTDDDVIVAGDWLEQIATPLLNMECDAVTGQITLAPQLLRSWMTPLHRWFLASSQDAQMHEGNHEMIGANMGFRRAVLKQVPAFDPELGPGGARGLGEDTLFGWQLSEAGYKIKHVPTAAVIHQCDVSRLKRLQWINEARKHGRSDAYRIHHWKHANIKTPRLDWFYCGLKLCLKRLLQPPPNLHDEGCPRWEIGYICRMELCKQFCADRRQPRKYKLRGLTKL